jgi:CRP-like cAMP-binding protein
MVTSTVPVELLKRCVHLQDLTRDALAKLAAIAEDTIVNSGTKVIEDMDPADNLYLLVKGEVNICCELGSGEIRVMDTVGEGELFAWSALVEPFRYTSTAIAATDCELIAFDARRLRAMCEQDLDLGYQVLTRIVTLLTNRLESVRVQLAAS